MLYTKSFESEIEAKEFCRTAFGEKYIGELAYGIGVDLQAADVGSNLFVLLKFYSKWKYMKSGILDKIDDFTCQCTTEWWKNREFGHQQIECIGLKKDTQCLKLKKNRCPADVYNITTICELSSKMPKKE